jgi:hypothetical protein
MRHRFEHDVDASNNRVRRKPAAPDRAELGGARLQHAIASIARQAHPQDAAERGQKTLAVNIPYRGSNGPLHLLIPSRALLRNTLPGSG